MTTDTELVATIRRLLADSEDARKALQRANGRFQDISNELLNMRLSTDPEQWRTAYAQASQ